MSESEASLLNWLGMDVVDDDCRRFTRDLYHYALHVSEGGEAKRPPLGARCKLEA